MPKIHTGSITMNYDQQGSGEPLILIPYLAVDYACYAFQVADYAKHFTCISVDLRVLVELTNPKEPTPPNSLPMMLRPSCRHWAYHMPMSPAFPWVQLPGCGWRPGILKRSNRCLSIARGQKPIPFSK